MTQQSFKPWQEKAAKAEAVRQAAPTKVHQTAQQLPRDVPQLLPPHTQERPAKKENSVVNHVIETESELIFEKSEELPNDTRQETPKFVEEHRPLNNAVRNTPNVAQPALKQGNGLDALAAEMKEATRVAESASTMDFKTNGPGTPPQQTPPGARPSS